MNYYVKVDTDIKLFVEDLNPDSEKTILFIHGWPLEHTAFEYQLNKLPDMGYRCVAIDLRGYGKSSKPECGYYYDRMADDIRNVIETLCLKEITLVGHSMGGAISIKYVSKYEGFGINKLCLLGAAAPCWVKTDNWKYGYTKEEVNSLIDSAYNDRPKMIEKVTDSFFYQYITKPMMDWFASLCLSAAGWSTAKSLMSLRDEKLFTDLNNIRIPTLILHGTHDKICPYPFAEYMNRNILNSTLVPFTGSGHGLFIEEKERVTRLISKFIES